MDESCKTASIALSSNDTKVKKFNKECSWYSVNGNFSIFTSDSLFPLCEIESPESQVTPLTKTIASPKSDHQLENANI